MTSQPASLPTAPRLARLPTTLGALRGLRAEARRLRARLRAGLPSTSTGGEGVTVTEVADAALDLHRLQAIDAALHAAVVVKADGMAIVGSRVTVRETDGARIVLTLVPPGLAVPGAGRISPDSPLGEALLGRRAGDCARVAAPAGAREIVILEVR